MRCRKARERPRDLAVTRLGHVDPNERHVGARGVNQREPEIGSDLAAVGARVKVRRALLRYIVDPAGDSRVRNSVV